MIKQICFLDSRATRLRRRENDREEKKGENDEKKEIGAGFANARIVPAREGIHQHADGRE